MKILQEDDDTNKTADPVCGMLVDYKTGFSSAYQKKIYHFCSEKCKTLFEQEPELFISMQGEREKVMEARRTESLKRMAAQLTHEIRNPLTSIGGFARRVLKNLPEDAHDREYMKRVIEDVERLEQMVNRLVLTETEDFDMRSSDINEIIKEVLKSFEDDFEEDGMNLTLSLKEVPLIVVDREKIKLVFFNLIRNAIEAMSGMPRRLTVSTDMEGEYLVISIKDTGKGIPEEKIKYIFDPFFTSKIYGPGLGLTFVKKVIVAHGGEIKVKSKVDRGSTFLLKLPLYSGPPKWDNVIK